MDIRPRIHFDLDKPRDWFGQDVKWTLATGYQLSTLSALDLDRVHHLSHALLQEMILSVCRNRISEFQTLCVGFKVVEIIKLCCIVPCWLNKMGFNFVDMCWNLVPVWACNMECGPLLLPTIFKISFVHASNAMEQMLLCCIAVFQYFSIICQCGASANPVPARRVA